jgi:hypothetical protein
MSFALLIIGAVLLTSAVLNTQSTLWSLLKGDFSGPSNFWYWLVLFLILGAIGYVPKAKPVSDGLLVLFIIVIFVSKGGFFEKFSSALQGTTSTAPNTSTSTAPNTSTSTATTQTAGLQPLQSLQPLQGLGGLSNAGSLGGGVTV